MLTHPRPRARSKSALAQLSGTADLIQSGLQAYRPDAKQPARRRDTAPAAGAPALSACALAAGVEQCQLPALFRHQQLGGATRRVPAGLRCDPSARAAAYQRRSFTGIAARSHRWTLGSASVLRSSPERDHPRSAWPQRAVLHGCRKDPRARRVVAALSRHCRNDRLRVVEHDLARVDRPTRSCAARADLARLHRRAARLCARS